MYVVIPRLCVEAYYILKLKNTITIRLTRDGISSKYTSPGSPFK